MNRDTRPDRIASFVFAVAVMLCTVTAFAAPNAAPPELNVEIASAWWPEIENT
jgi:hypothetical protein